MIKKYKIKKTLVIGAFDDKGDQQDIVIVPHPDFWLESDGTTIWLCQKSESSTLGQAIEVFLEKDLIEEKKD
jgi:hypothetical protein